MILFNKDWSTQKAKPDFTTKNKSFVEMAVLLNKMGVKNFAFFLALHDQDLLGVDPRDPNLSQEMLGKIALECKVNPWYFFREVALVPGGGDGVMLRANRANICMWWLFYNHITNIQIQPRQTGKSLCADFLNVEEISFRVKGTEINLITKDDDLRKRNIVRLKEIFDLLPRYLDMRTKKDANNTEFITINALGNRLNTFVPRNDERQAEKLCRGFSSPIHFYDELPFQSYCRIGYPSSVSAMDARVDEAKSRGTDWGIVITTTAHKKDDRDGRFVYEMITKACNWDERLFDCDNEEELRSRIIRNSDGVVPIVYSCFNHRQLGYTDEWLREKMANASGSPDDAARDYLCKWTSGTASSPFTPAMSDKIRASELRVEHLEFTKEDYILRWYIPESNILSEMNNNKYVIGLDTSEASGGDDIGFYMVNARTLKVACTAKINETNIITFAQWLAEFMGKYKNTILVPERRSTGSSVVDYLLKILPSIGEDPSRRIFNLVAHDSDIDYARYEDMKRNARTGDALIRYRKLFGYATSGVGTTSRSQLYSTTLFNIIKIIDCRFGDLDVINQLLGLIWKNGRIDHDKDGHDDMVVSMLLAYWFILSGKNHAHYGLEPFDIMSDVEDHSNMNPIDKIKAQEQQALRAKLDKLADEYSRERDDIKLTRLEMEMRNIERKLVMEANEINTVDELIRKVKETKLRNRSNRVRNNNSVALGLNSGRVATSREISSYEKYYG